MSQRKAIREAMEAAALAGAQEMKTFLDSYHGDDPVARARVQVGANAVTGYTRLCSSENNMIGMMMMAAERTGVSAQQTLAIAKEAGLLPGDVESQPKTLRLKKRA